MRGMLTPEGSALTGMPWNVYPRPQMRRDRWLCLNGPWEWVHDGETRTIQVPFCPESLLSGIGEYNGYGTEMIYRKRFSIPADWAGQRILLHFGAVNRWAVVELNGVELCTHENGYLPFSVELTESLLETENTLTVRVINDLSRRQPWGKQKRDTGGMWYTPVSGIWQTVWLEPVPQDYIQSLTVRTALDSVEIAVTGPTAGTVTLSGVDYALRDGTVKIPMENPIHWTPEQPYLYDFTVTCGTDQITSYFALRTIRVETVAGKPRLCLNGKPYFFHGLLDQGYWSDGIYTPAAPVCYENDIMAMKKLGFNTLRKHIKIEPEQFYYDCDRLGMVVFQDMVNCGTYRYIRDTVLPTIGFQQRADRKLHRDPETRSNFRSAMVETVRHLYNHPSICLWTIFNEGWGQFCADEMYDLLRSVDHTRLIDSTSGWFHQTKTDVESLHTYFSKLALGDTALPQLISEFGGYSCKIPEHSTNLKKTYGYRKFTDREEFVQALRALYREDLIPLIREGLCGAIYTQVSDVEDETNGLLTYDRCVRKIEPAEFQDIADEMQRIMAEIGEEAVV